MAEQTLDDTSFLFSFKGRIPRSKFWLFMLWYVLGLVGVLALDVVAGAEGVLAGLLMLAALWPSLAVQVKRLHDFDYSGWWLLASVIPLVGLGIFLACGIHKGTAGDNRFGPDPLRSVPLPSPQNPMRSAG
ncbi:DUF805 domain-containing protein [Nitrospira sp. Kam-Ns4a]